MTDKNKEVIVDTKPTMTIKQQDAYDYFITLMASIIKKYSSVLIKNN